MHSIRILLERKQRTKNSFFLELIFYWYKRYASDIWAKTRDLSLKTRNGILNPFSLMWRFSQWNRIFNEKRDWLNCEKVMSDEKERHFRENWWRKITKENISFIRITCYASFIIRSWVLWIKPNIESKQGRFWFYVDFKVIILYLMRLHNDIVHCHMLILLSSSLILLYFKFLHL